METKLILSPLPSKFRIYSVNSSHRIKSSTCFTTTHRRQPSVLRATISPDNNSNGSREGQATENNRDTSNAATKLQAPTTNLNIRYRARSRRQAKQEQQKPPENLQKAPTPAKKWEDMTLTDKALNIYLGEKGLLFWLNKFAYASIFVVIGGWILFRFVGPYLGLYQLSSPPLSPTSLFKDG